VVGRASLAHVSDELKNRILADAGHATVRSNAISFYESADNLRTAIITQAIHGKHYA
jgi:hypothetical protein